MARSPRRNKSSESGCRPWHQSTFAFAVLSGVLLWAAFPPMNLWPLAWLAPVGWLYLLQVKTLPGRHPYLQIYLAAVVHWLLVVSWVRLPHWSAYFGWPVLSFYLACYLPPFIAISRFAIHRWKVPLVITAPIVWTCLELARGYIVTGFSLALLGHTQVDWNMLIQIADLTGAYGVSFLVMFISACLFQMFPREGKQIAWWPIIPVAFALCGCLAYGASRQNEPPMYSDPERSAKIALIQGSIDTVFESVDRTQEHHQHYLELTKKVVQEHQDLDLIIWPESMFSYSWIEHSSDATVPKEYLAKRKMTDEEFRRGLDIQGEEFKYYVKRVVQAGDSAVPLLCGVSCYYFDAMELKRYNSAILFDASGNIQSRYDKMHPVMFGEYVPFGNYFPWVYKLTPTPGGLTPGTRPQAFDINGVTFSPSICFENTVPHLIRRQIRQLREEYQEPDILATVTNDGWFWGSSLLDLHLTCGRFRAVENRKPVVIAANTGFSAVIDSNGRLLQKGARRATDALVAEVQLDLRYSEYLEFGDVFSGLCLGLSICAALVGSWTSWIRPKSEQTENTRPKKV